MLQADLFDGFKSKWKYIANGAFGSVYASPHGNWVIKTALNDGTRAWLEWCMLKREQGKWHKGMPLVDFVVASGQDRYIAGMKRYRIMTFDERCETFSDNLSNHAIIQEFEEATGYQANDMHGGNVLWDEQLKHWVVTDPCSKPYYGPLNECEEFFELKGV